MRNTELGGSEVAGAAVFLSDGFRIEDVSIIPIRNMREYGRDKMVVVLVVGGREIEDQEGLVGLIGFPRSSFSLCKPSYAGSSRKAWR